MVKLEKVLIEDAEKMLQLQYDSFIVYAKKYGDFDTNPYHMTLDRMKFNINYWLGQYYKLIETSTNELIGGIFAFELDTKDTMKIAQFYLKEEFRSKGYGQYVLQKLFKMNPKVKMWYIDTILQEEYNLEFYKHVGFNIVDEEEEHDGLTFVTMLKKN